MPEFVGQFANKSPHFGSFKEACSYDSHMTLKREISGCKDKGVTETRLFIVTRTKHACSHRVSTQLCLWAPHIQVSTSALILL